MKIIDYAILCGEDIIDLTSKVWDAIRQDWQPTGGVVVDPRTGQCYQAVIKRTRREK